MYITSVIDDMLNKNSIYDKPSKKGSAYFITEHTSNNSGEKIIALATTEHSSSTNDKNNPVDSSDNLTTSQIHIGNDTKKKEPKILQRKELVSTDPPLNSRSNRDLRTQRK